MTEIEQFLQIIEESDNIVFFGGAGVSTESGIPDFRSVDGLYHQQYAYPPETILSHSFFLHHTEEFFDFYWKKLICDDAKPNPCHRKLAQLEQIGKLSAVVTQNIDGLHQAAGSKNVYELHGSVHRNYCMKCGAFIGLVEIGTREGIPHCSCGGIIKPDVVLYEEGLDSSCISKTVAAIAKADTLIIGGTSLAVYPAAGFIDYFNGKHLVIINKSETSKNVNADLILREPIGEVFSKIKL